MKGYPKYIATVQDFEFLLSDPKYKDRALADLKAIVEKNDDKATVAVLKEGVKISPDESWQDEDYDIQIIDNLMPLWKKKGFKSREDVRDLMEKI